MINMRKIIRNKRKLEDNIIYGKEIRRIHMVGNFGLGVMGRRVLLRKYQK
jgi:hypothetical protein